MTHPLDMVRDPQWVKAQITELHELSRKLKDRSLSFMEVCGTHTMSVFRNGIHSLLPDNIHLVSGPGCPVCVTPSSLVDMALELATQPHVIVTTFGDMMKVPGKVTSLSRQKASGSDIRVVYSPLDALALAKDSPDYEIVFIGVGFETTAPAIGATIQTADQKNIRNFSVLCSHKTMPQAMRAIVEAGEIHISGFLCPGHVSAVTGANLFNFVPGDYHLPCVVAGFEAGDILQGLVMLTRQILDNRAEVEIQYQRCVSLEGNLKAQAVIQKVFEPCDTEWRGFGIIPGSGLKIKKSYSAWDAEIKFTLIAPESVPVPGCLCGEILRGVKTPADCALFGTRCTPEDPVGACMVSNEGTCAAYFRYHRDFLSR